MVCPFCGVKGSREISLAAWHRFVARMWGIRLWLVPEGVEGRMRLQKDEGCLRGDRTMQALDEIGRVAGTLENDYVAEWSRQGKKVVGYVCSYLPEEILHAADILPYRITGQGCDDTSLADTYLARVNCTFARCCLENGLSGRFDFLAGAVYVNGCDHIRRAFENWEAHEKRRPFMYVLPVPHMLTEEATAWYRDEVLAFKDSLEDHFGVQVSMDRLSESVAIYNETRRLVRRLYDLQAGQSPPLAGAQMLKILSAGTRLPKDRFNQLLGDLLDEAREVDGGQTGKIRLLVAGSIMDDADLVENVEDLGAVVVADTLCIGSRSHWDLTEENGDPLQALIRRYFHHAPCPRMYGHYRERLAFVKEQAKRAGVDGVILEQIKFCDLHGTDNALLKRDLEEENIPVLELERQYGPLADAGRVRTRVQAFLERIRRVR
jgi:bzd-type benzoyl-CoA reductase N subunit